MHARHKPKKDNSKACCRRASKSAEILHTSSVQMSVCLSICVSRFGHTVTIVISDWGGSNRRTHHDEASTDLCCMKSDQLWPSLKSSFVSSGVLRMLRKASVSLCTVLLRFIAAT